MLLLYAVGTGPVRGFAVTISLGIITSMFTATVLTRLLMVALAEAATGPRLLSVTTWLPAGARRHPHPRSCAARDSGLIVSVLLSLASIGLFYQPGLNYGHRLRRRHRDGDADAGAGRFRPSCATSSAQLNLGPVQLQQFGAADRRADPLRRQPGDEADAAGASRRCGTAGGEVRPARRSGASRSVGATVSGELFQRGHAGARHRRPRDAALHLVPLRMAVRRRRRRDHAARRHQDDRLLRADRDSSST